MFTLITDRCPACKGNLYVDDGRLTCLLCTKSFTAEEVRHAKTAEKPADRLAYRSA